jgi:glycerol-3-phosphate dehydrogenase
VEGRYRYLSRREVRRREPQVTKKQYGGFFMPSAGVVNPFEVTIAYAEHAAQNGVAFSFSTVLEGCELRIEDGERESGPKEVVALQTNRGTVRVGALINAAGNWADTVAELAGDRFFSLHGRRGVDLILDRRLAASQRHILGMPSLLKGKSDHSKGGGLVPCIEGNLLAGPTADETPAREDYRTTQREVRELERHIALNRAAAPKDVITYFAGVRPATWEEDFIIRRSRRVRNLIHLAGIQSPGLASAPAIAEEAVRLTREIFGGVRELKENPVYSSYRQPRVRPALLSREQRRSLIHRRPEYGRIICRCEEVSEGEIRDALASPLEPTSVDAVKRRCRAGAGRCHGGFCLPRIMEVIADVRGVPLTRVSKKGGGSWIVAEETKQHAPVTGGAFGDARRSGNGSGVDSGSGNGGGEAGR